MAIVFLLAAAHTHTSREHVGTWSARPLWTPTCVNGAFPHTEQDPTRTFCCDDREGYCDAAYKYTSPPSVALPHYTTDPRRDHHHVVDGPMVGNGNIGLSVGVGNRWNISYPWIDLFLSSNSFWAISGQNHTHGTPFRGRLALPGRMLLGVARLSLPSAEWTTANFTALQSFDNATVHVTLMAMSGAKLHLDIFASPRAPLFWTSLSLQSKKTVSMSLTLNTSVLGHFYHRGEHFNTSFAVGTTAKCTSDGSAVVTRAADFSNVTPPKAQVVGAIHQSVGGGSATVTCETTGSRYSSLTFSLLSNDTTPTVISTIVRTSRDPSCVARPIVGAAPLCGLSTTTSDVASVTQSIADDLSSSKATWARASAKLNQSMAAYWRASSISLPGDSATEDFWFGAQAALNSAIPHEGQEQTPPGLYGPWVTQDNPGWHGDFTIDYNYEAIFYGVMSSNHEELMLSYPEPMLDFMPSATAYAEAKSQLVFNKTCPGLHFPDVLAPWGFAEGDDGVNADAGLMSNGAYANLPIVWAWEYGARANLSVIEHAWWPLIKGNADFYACWMQYNMSTGYYHDLHDCTNESPGICTSMDTVLTLSMARRTLEVAIEMAEAITLPGSNGSSLWSKVLRLMAPLPLGSLYVPEAKEGGKLIANRTTKCTWCAWDKNDKTRTPTVGDCQWPGNDNGALNSATCNASVPDATAPLGRACPKGMGLCRSSAFGSARKSDYSPNLPSGGNSQSIFPAFPADYIGTNHSLAGAAASTVEFAKSWAQGNSFTKIFSAAARLVGPGLLDAADVHAEWKTVLANTQQPNGIPYNPYSGFETVGAVEYVNYMLLQSDPGGFLGFFEAWPWQQLGSASFRTLRARGAFLVTSSISGKGIVGATTLVSERGETVVLRRPQSWGKGSMSVTRAGTRVTLQWSGAGDSEFVSFATVARGEYSLVG